MVACLSPPVEALLRRATRCSVAARRCGSATRAEPYGTVQRWPCRGARRAAARGRERRALSPAAREVRANTAAAAGAPRGPQRLEELAARACGRHSRSVLFQPSARSILSSFSLSQRSGQERSGSPVSTAVGTRQLAAAQPALAVTVPNQINQLQVRWA